MERERRLNLYRVEIIMTALVCAGSETEARRTALSRDVLDDARDSADADAWPVARVTDDERGALAWGVPDEHPWRDLPVETIVAEIAKRDGIIDSEPSR